MGKRTLSLDGITTPDEEYIDSLDEVVEMDFSDIKTKEEVQATIKKREAIGVNAYSLDGEFIAAYESIIEAAKATEASFRVVYSCCKGYSLSSEKYGKIWLFRGDDIEERLRQIDVRKEKYRRVRKKVDEYSLKGKLLFQYPSSAIAAKVNNLTSNKISSCCNGKALYVGNRIFLWHGDDIKQRLSAVKEALYLESIKRKKCRPVDEYTLDGQYVKGYPSCSAAARETNIHVSQICRCCLGYDPRGNYLQVRGRIFLYTGESISARIDLINGLKENRK